MHETITWSRAPDVPGADAFHVSHNQRSWRVFHETYTVCTVVGGEGSARWHYRGKIHESASGSVSAMEPGEVHYNTSAPPAGTFYVALIHPDLVASLCAEAGLPSTPHLSRAVLEDSALHAAFRRFHEAMAGREETLRKQSLLAEAVELLLQRCAESGGRRECGDHPRLLAARDYLHAHWDEPVTLERLAEVAGLSRFHLLRAFRRRFGLPPHSYQLSLRIERVRSLLRRGYGLQEIEAGFADQSHLSRNFKRVMGLTPGEYARLFR